jgi:hypothetical protein
VAERRHRTFGLLGTVVIIFVVMPLVRTGSPAASLLGGLLFCAVILWGFWTISEYRRQRIVGAVLMAPALVFTVLHHIPPRHEGLEIAWQILISLALGFLIVMLWRRLFRTERVTADTLSTAVSGYFLLGILWAVLYSLIHQFDAAAFEGVQEEAAAGSFFYFSFVTLTTLGYGDITPVTDAARTAAVLEAVLGLLYMAITIARLVGLHIAAAPSE